MPIAITISEKLFGIKIIWNYFATAHGKVCVFGLRAVVKKKVRLLVNARNVVVNDAADFVRAFNLSKSFIKVIEMTIDDMHRTNMELGVFTMLDTAKRV